MSKDEKKPAVENEVFLRQIGCPYPLGDERTTFWLEGYKVGMADGGKIAFECVKEELNR